MTNFRQWWQTNIDVKEQKDAYFRNKTNATLNQSGIGATNPIYWITLTGHATKTTRMIKGPVTSAT